MVFFVGRNRGPRYPKLEELGGSYLSWGGGNMTSLGGADEAAR